MTFTVVTKSPKFWRMDEAWRRRATELMSISKQFDLWTDGKTSRAMVLKRLHVEATLLNSATVRFWNIWIKQSSGRSTKLRSILMGKRLSECEKLHNIFLFRKSIFNYSVFQLKNFVSELEYLPIFGLFLVLATRCDPTLTNGWLLMILALEYSYRQI